MNTIGNVSGDILKQYIERIERLENEKNDITANIRDIYAEAKSGGFDIKVMKQVIKVRKMDQNERTEQEELFEIYKKAIGMAD